MGPKQTTITKDREVLAFFTQHAAPVFPGSSIVSLVDSAMFFEAKEVKFKKCLGFCRGQAVFVLFIGFWEMEGQGCFAGHRAWSSKCNARAFLSHVPSAFLA